jgi:hypothetical protein
MIDDNTIVPSCMLPELVKLKYIVSEEEPCGKGALLVASEKLTVALWFTGVIGSASAVWLLVSTAPNEVTEVGILVKRKFIV